MSQWQSGGSSSSVRVVAGGVVVEATTITGPNPGPMQVPPGAVVPHPMMGAPYPHPMAVPPPGYAMLPPGVHPMMVAPPGAYPHPMAVPPPGYVMAHPPPGYAMLPPGAHPHAHPMMMAPPRHALPAGGVFAMQAVPRMHPQAAPERALATRADDSGEHAPVLDERRDGEARTAQGAFLLAVSASLMALGGLMAAAVGAAAPGVLVLAGAGTVAAGVTGLRLLRSAKTPVAGSAGSVPASLQQRILQAAHEAGGKLTVTGIARTLNISLEEAENSLGSMSKSGYVDVEIDSDSGVVQYVFREMVPPRGALPAPAATSTPTSTST